MKHLTESKKTVTFQIVNDNAKLLSQDDMRHLRKQNSGRRGVRRYHSQPVLPKSLICEESMKTFSRWASPATTSSTTPMKRPKRSVEQDRWRVGRNYSDSSLHSPPKRRESPSSFAVFSPIVATTTDDAPTLPIREQKEARSETVMEEGTDFESKNQSEMEEVGGVGTSKKEEQGEGVAPVIFRVAFSGLIGHHNRSKSLLLAPFFNLARSIMMLPIWSSIFRFVTTLSFEEYDEAPVKVARCTNTAGRHSPKDETLPDGHGAQRISGE